jgi:hypothetical protein
MKIGLIDVDGHNFPNLALMKISAWHKAQGDQVEMFFPMNHYDKVYMSKVFDFTPDFETCINADEVVKGGTGYGIGNYLPKEIEHQYPDYSLYGITDAAYGFISRGCPRQCKFCNVSEQQGKVSRKVADLLEFWNGQKNIVLLDPNITACKDANEILDSLIITKSYIDFSQGLDVRLITEEMVDKINRLKIKMLHFAWDNYEFNTYEKLKEYRPKLKFDDRRLRVYVLTNFNTKQEQDLERIYKLKEIGYDPYVMIFNKQTAPRRIKQMQRWVNNKFIFRSGQAETFEDYLKGVKP